MGRYRVKFDFDLKTWKNGEESLWVRLAKPYAGSTYGFHFPLIDGTGVAIAFSEGNPDRPYIAHALHDSTHPDHVTTINKHRNVIRTPANNKLRMDDKRGQEHIKLATEYGKTQLNIGHLVNQNKEQRGEGIELSTAENVYIKSNALQKMGPEISQIDSIYLPCKTDDSLYHIKFLLKDTNTNEPLKNVKYEIILANGIKLKGISDNKGYTKKIISENNEIVNLRIFKPSFTNN